MPDKFEHVRIGTRVRRSRHWYKQHTSWPRGQLGIVVDRNIYKAEDGSDALMTWPVVHWEGEHGPSGVHPLNVDVAVSAYLRGIEARRITRERHERLLARPVKGRRTGARSR